MASFGSRSTPRSASGSSQPRRKEPTPSGSGVCSLAQTRLDRIAHPTGVWYRSWVHWTLRIRFHPQEYTPERLTARERELEPHLESLRALVSHPPESWTGEQWATAEDRLQELDGQLQAIRAERKRRSSGEPGTC